MYASEYSIRTASGRWLASNPLPVYPRDSAHIRDIYDQLDGDGLSRHVVEQHIAVPLILEVAGVHYDAELAAFGGISLQTAADSAISRLGAIDACANNTFHSARARQYRGDLLSAVRQMQKLGVAAMPVDSPDLYRRQVAAAPTDVWKDSFFSIYGLRRLTTRGARAHFDPHITQ